MSRPPYRIKLFLFTRLWLNRIRNVSQALHQGVWLGLFDNEHCTALTEYHYTSNKKDNSEGDASYFSERYNLSGFFPWEKEVFDTYFGDCDSILIGSAGGGRELLAVSHHCQKVDAFECNANLSKYCAALLDSQGMKANVVTAEPDKVPESMGVYDGGILGWGAYIHIVGHKRRIRFLEDFRKHIKPGGPFLLSFFVYKESFSKRLPYRIAKVIRSIRRSDPVEPGDTLSSTFDHHFKKQEIRKELEEAGFTLIFYSEKAFGHAVARALPNNRGPETATSSVVAPLRAETNRRS